MADDVDYAVDDSPAPGLDPSVPPLGDPAPPAPAPGVQALEEQG